MNLPSVVKRDARTSVEKTAGDVINTISDARGQRIQCERHTEHLEITPRNVGYHFLSPSFSSEDSPSRLTTLTRREMKDIASRLTAKIISKDTLKEISSLLRGLRTQ